MAGSGQRSRSRGELIRQRSRSQFVGRRAQLSLFAENLTKDPEAAEFLFHVRGVGGVGKSTLVRQWQQAARAAGAVTAVVDENDVHGVQQALVELARQLAEESGPFKEFDRAAEQYRREQEAAAEPMPVEGVDPAEGGASVSSRLVSQAALGAVSLIPGAGVMTAMANPDTAAQGLDRLRAGVRGRSRRTRGGDAVGVSRAFVSEVGRLCDRYPWVVLFLDTWEQTGRYLDEWLRELLSDAFGSLPANVIVVMAGRDELRERDWAELRAQVADVPLEEFDEAETRALLAARGVTEPKVAEAVWQLSMGLPLLVELFALTKPAAAGDVDAGGDVVDAAVDRFVQWITSTQQREAVLACALVPQLNEDVFVAAVPPEAQGLWSWLCDQPFVTGRGDFKQYHAVVRASMVRQQRTRSPQRWVAAHLQLAEAHAGWRAAAEQGLPEGKRWSDARWRRHHVDETYHRLCAQPAAHLPSALDEAVHAAGRDTAALRQWADALDQAARDTADPDLVSWARRLQDAVSGDEPAMASLTALLTDGRLSTVARAWAHTYRGRHFYLEDRDEEALAELDRALGLDPGNSRAWAYRGDSHRWLGHSEQAIGDLSTALTLDPAYAWALLTRGEAHREAEHYDEAITDLTAALDLDPTLSWAHSQRGEAHRQAERYDEAIAEFTAALALDPTDAWALGSRGQARWQADRFEEAITDLTAALELDPTETWPLVVRGMAHRDAGHDDEAITDLTAVLDQNPTNTVAMTHRGIAHREADRCDEAITDFTAALDSDPTSTLILIQRGIAHLKANRRDEAITDFTTALALDPSSSWALTSRGITHREFGRYEEAVTDFTAALDLDPTNAGLLVSRGTAQHQAGRYAKAITDFTAALDMDPTLARALVLRGKAHWDADHDEEAIRDFTAALALDPTDALVLVQRGISYGGAANSTRPSRTSLPRSTWYQPTPWHSSPAEWRTGSPATTRRPLPTSPPRSTWTPPWPWPTTNEVKPIGRPSVMKRLSPTSLPRSRWTPPMLGPWAPVDRLTVRLTAMKRPSPTSRPRSTWTLPRHGHSSNAESHTGRQIAATRPSSTSPRLSTRTLRLRGHSPNGP